MKIHSPIGSKERFLEMFQGVNKINLNEVATGVMQSGTQLVAKAFEELKNKQANIQQTNTQTVGDENFIEIITSDEEGNKITFTFKVNSTEGDQDGVFNVNDVVLTKFKLQSQTLNVEMPENMQAVQDFNAQYGSEIMGVVGEYADFETDSVSVDTEEDVYAEAIDLIDKIPYKKGSEEIQTHKNYADNKPTNPEVRVHNDELQQFVKEEEEEFIPHGSYTLGNAGGYEIMLNDSGDAARVRDAYGSDNPQTSDWLEIEYVPDEETGESEPVIDPNGYNIPLNMVMRIQEADNDLQQFVKEMEDFVAGTEEEDNLLAIPPDFNPDEFPKHPSMDDKSERGVDPYAQVDEPEYEDGEASPEEQALFSQAYDTLVAAGNDTPTAIDIENEVNRLQGNVKPVEKTRAIPKGAEAFYESTDQDKYEDVVFVQGEEANEPLEILRNQGEDAALKYLQQWHDSGNHMGSAELGHGSSDQTYEKDGYHMAWNFPLNYIGLQYDLGGLDEEAEKGDYPDQMGKKFKPKNQMPKKKKRPQGVVKLGEESEIPQEYWGNDEELAETEEIPDEKPEDGDFIEGGIGDDADVSDFNAQQIMIGMGVEMEHTNDPKVALEIAMDHLMEIPDYYTRLNKMEKEAGIEGETDEGMVDNTPEDEEMTDELLGYKPHNVSDYVSEEIIDERRDDLPIGAKVRISDGSGVDSNKTGTIISPSEVKTNGRGVPTNIMGAYKPVDWNNEVAILLDDGNLITMFKNRVHLLNNLAEDDGMEEYGGEIGDRYQDGDGNQYSVRDKVDGGVTLQGQGGEKEIATRDIQFLKKLGEAKVDKREVITEEQIKSARQVLKNRGFVDGMTKKEAVQLLIKHNIG